MKFDISHELDTTREALEDALMSPQLGQMLCEKLDSLDTVVARTNEIDPGELRRVWRFQAKAPLKILRGRNITRDMMTWDEVWTYRHADLMAKWHVVPRPGVDPDAPWRQRFEASGTYHLEPLGDGRTRRRVTGNITVQLRLIGGLVERLAVGEMRKSFDAEASVLRTLCRQHAAAI